MLVCAIAERHSTLRNKVTYVTLWVKFVIIFLSLRLKKWLTGRRRLTRNSRDTKLY